MSVENQSSYKKILVIATRCIIIHNDKILLVADQDRGNDEFWYLPGGWIDGLEYVYDAAEREVYEETGLKVVAKKIVKISQSLYDDRGRHNNLVNKFQLYIYCSLLDDQDISEKTLDKWVDSDNALVSKRRFFSFEQISNGEIKVPENFKQIDFKNIKNQEDIFLGLLDPKNLKNQDF